MKAKTILTSIVLVTSLNLSQTVSASTQHPHYLLTRKAAPNGLKILPKPPSATSKAFLNDQEQYHLGHALKGSKRWQQAQKDANLGFPQSNVDPIAKQFEVAFGSLITAKRTPAIYQILQEIKHDASLVTDSAKMHYMRTRPFVFFHQSSCVPKDEPSLKKNGSYPSGHTTIGWASALVLAQIKPSRQDQILKRGYDFGQSRVICGAHWQSDVDAGRVTGAALVATLHTYPTFERWIQMAKVEVSH